MSEGNKASGRNQSMECAKLIASFFVVFIHVHFPGKFGELVDYLGQFAVPMFFAITGYFNYEADSRTVLRRTKHIFALYIAGNVGQAAYLLVENLYQSGGGIAYIKRLLPDQKGLADWLAVQSEFIAGHLWYLHALLVVYLLYWMYVRFFGEKKINYIPLFYFGATMLAAYFILRVVAVLYVSEVIDITRNAFLTGIPMFCVGLFIRAYQEQIFAGGRLNRKTLGILILIGEIMTVQQWVAGGGGTAFGTFITIFALILFLVQTPALTKKPSAVRFILKCGSWSTYIYLYHLIVAELFNLLLSNASMADDSRIEWLRPLIVLAASWAVAVLCDWGVTSFQRRRADKPIPLQ